MKYQFPTIRNNSQIWKLIPNNGNNFWLKIDD